MLLPDGRLIILSVDDDAGLNYVEHCESKKEMLKTFIYYVNLVDPDVIQHINGDGFDFPNLVKRCEKYGIEFTIGRGEKPVTMAYMISFGNSRREVYTIPGRINLDHLYVNPLAGQHRSALKFMGETYHDVHQDVSGDQLEELSGTKQGLILTYKYGGKDVYILRDQDIAEDYVGYALDLSEFLRTSPDRAIRTSWSNAAYQNIEICAMDMGWYPRLNPRSRLMGNERFVNVPDPRRMKGVYKSLSSFYKSLIEERLYLNVECARRPENGPIMEAMNRLQKILDDPEASRFSKSLAEKVMCNTYKHALDNENPWISKDQKERMRGKSGALVLEEDREQMLEFVFGNGKTLPYADLYGVICADSNGARTIVFKDGFAREEQIEVNGRTKTIITSRGLKRHYGSFSEYVNEGREKILRVAVLDGIGPARKCRDKLLKNAKNAPSEKTRTKCPIPIEYYKSRNPRVREAVVENGALAGDIFVYNALPAELRTGIMKGFDKIYVRDDIAQKQVNLSSYPTQLEMPVVSFNQQRKLGAWFR